MMIEIPPGTRPDNSTERPYLPFEVRLIEVNTNPCIEEPNTLLRQYVPRMLDDMLKITLDPLFGLDRPTDD